MENGKYSVLICDDMQQNLELLGEMLISQDYDVIAASEGEKAILLAEKYRPDIILLDLMMPGLNGFEVAERLKQNEHLSKIPIIFITAKTDTEDLVKGFEVGGVDYITKPFYREELIVRINNHLQLARSKETLEECFEMIDHYVQTTIANNEGIVTHVSEATCQISQFSKEELVGHSHMKMHHPDYSENFFSEIGEKIKAGETWEGEVHNIKKDGSDYWVESIISPIYSKRGKLNGFQAICVDITDKKRIKEMAVKDQLTGLYNRFKLIEVLEYELEQSRRYQSPFSVILLDVDDFKHINDNLGHQEGDRVLCGIAQATKEQVRSADTLGRWGGEEFLVVLPKTDIAGAVLVAEKICQAVANSELSSERVTVSVGVSTFRGDDTIDLVVKRADEAMYRAKGDGKNCVRTDEGVSA